jgi:aspartate racemase
MILETARRAALVHPGARVCILATLGTSSSPLYRDRLMAHGLDLVPLDTPSQGVVEAAIRSVKANDLEGGRRVLDDISGLLERHGADVAIVACTDLSYLVAEIDADLGIPMVDASDCLARFCLTYFDRQLRAGC